MELTRRGALKAGAGALTVTAATGFATGQSEEHVLELLAEENIDHDHACLHGDFDERTPLEAGETVDDAPSVDDTHVIWEATYQGEGYVVFDADGHFDDGPFVFYTADGSVQAVEGTELERGGVDACDSLDEYVQIEPEDGRIALELIADSDDGEPEEEEEEKEEEEEEEEEDDHDHHLDVVEFEVIDRDTDETEVYLHDDHWHGDPLHVPLDDTLSVEVYAEDADGEEIAFGDEYDLEAEIVDGADGLVSLESHGDHLHIIGEDEGVTEIIFQVWHDDHSEWDSPALEINVGEDDDHDDEEDDHDHDHDDEEDDHEEDEAHEADVEIVDVSVSSPDADRDSDARFNVITKNHSDTAVETTLCLDVGGISRSETIEIEAGGCQATWFCISHSELSVGEHDWSVWTTTADEATATGTLTVPMVC